MATPATSPLWPPADLAKRKVSWRLVDPGTLYRITRTDRLATEPFFGKSGGNRFDAPAGQFGVCYAAASVVVCFAETIIRSPATNAGYTPGGELPLSEKMLSERTVMGFKPGEKLRLVNFTGVPQLLLGADSTVSAAADHAIPQCWSLALHDAFPKADGILYMSRHISTKTAAAIFERAKTKDPVIGKNNYFGANVNRAARIEPVTAPWCAYASEQFAAMLAVTPGHKFRCEFIGKEDLAKNFDHCRLYRLV